MAEEFFTPGQVLGDGITLDRQLRRGAGWADWAAHSERHGAVRVRLLDEDVSAVFVERQDDLVPFRQIRDPSVARMIRVGQSAGRVWVAYSEPEAMLLARVIAPPPAGRGPLPEKHVRRLVSKATAILDALRPISPAGVLAVDDMALAGDGTVVLLGVGTARLTLAARGSDAWGDSASVAPEVRAERWSITEASDAWSLGVLGVTLALGRTPTRAELPAAIEQIAVSHSSALAQLLGWMTDDDPSMRPFSGEEIRASFTPGPTTSSEVAVAAAEAPAATAGQAPAAASEGADEPVSQRPRQMTEPLDALDVVEEVRARAAPPTATPPAAPPKVTGPAATRSLLSVDLNAALELLPAPTDGDPDEQVRWIYRKDGRDLGPVSATRIRELLTTGEIDEHIEIVDSFENNVQQLVDMPYFTDFVLDYLPMRAQQHIERQEKREQIVTEVRRTSRTAIVAGVLAAVAIAAVLVTTRVRPQPLPVDAIYATWSSTIPAPRPEYQSIAADEALLASLFDFSEPAPPAPPEPVAGARRRSGAAGASGEEAWQDEVFEEFSIAFDNTAPTRKLTNDEINGTIASHVGSLRPCFEAEMRANPAFRGASVNFSIRPNGGTFNISVEGRGGLSQTNERCLISAVRRIRFPEFNDVPMSVSFPFNIN